MTHSALGLAEYGPVWLQARQSARANPCPPSIAPTRVTQVLDLGEMEEG